MSDAKNSLPSSGVAELIQQLRNDGVEQGRQQAEALVTAAQQQAKSLLEQAQTQAAQIVSQAEQQAKQHRHATEQALNMAARDMVLDIQHQLSVAFDHQITRLVNTCMNDEDFLQRLIIELLHQLIDDIELHKQPKIALLLPQKVVGIDELRQHPDEYAKGQLSQWVQSVTSGLLREGVTISTHGGPSIKLSLQQQQMVVELTHEAITAMLLRHLQPRFRALLEGVIR